MSSLPACVAPQAERQGEPNGEAAEEEEGEEGGAKEAAGAGGEPRQRPSVTSPETVAQLPGVQPGCVLCTLRHADARALGLPTGEGRSDALTANAPMALSAWRGRASIAIMVDKAETTQMIDKIVSAAGQGLGRGKWRGAVASTSLLAERCSRTCALACGFALACRRAPRSAAWSRARRSSRSSSDVR